MRMTHEFESTGEAYDACQTEAAIKTGDILLIPTERVVGIADTWPVAVTVEHGKLHTPAEGVTLDACMTGRCDLANVEAAKQLARHRGWQVRD